MTTLNTYTQEAQTNAFNKHGAFFAFGKDQFNKKKEDGIKYIQLGAGLIAPKATYKELIKELDNINTSGIAQDIEENGIKKILWREFANYECQIAGSPEDAINALKDYHFKDDIIYTEWSSYWNWCIDNDQF